MLALLIVISMLCRMTFISDDLINEQSWLVARGVRHLALLQSIDKDEKAMDSMFVKLNQMSVEPAIPFVLPRKDIDCAMTGYASAKWVIDLLDWSYDQPLRQHHQIIGLLLGYSSEQIGQHDALEFAGNPSKNRSMSS